MTDNRDDTRPDPGIFFTNKMIFAMPEFSIGIDENGQTKIGHVAIHTAINMVPHWLDISLRHLLNTEQSHDGLMQSKNEKNNTNISRYLEDEFRNGMQTIMSSAIAIDAYYSAIKGHVEISNDIIKKWRENGTARYKQIAHVIAIGFNAENFLVKNIRRALKDIFRYRDLAVHPEFSSAPPALHVELNKVSDWRYAAFRFASAKIINW
ncbi:hypothetical protein SAMN04488082_102156 [Desulfomicrobium apsheronum]|uniref:DUF3800 domain-containing protein n=1 Tax=Desulfomicrobium apsheronum TaxID=52560 RepID=A0A1I3Q0J6_9BACT|nr:hypothetical protein [Desulfomicrobium apsheronum]SFJ26676.1 hypothetical protein SAMN04488082_102156 [Desulfomicrobium apsheronum]